jgi:ATP adenylyltransferase
MSEDPICHICSQIVGESSNDLIATTLGYSTNTRTALMDSERFVVFPSLGALALGHVLICPKAHVPSIASLTVEDRRELSLISHRLVKVLSETLQVPVHRFEHGTDRNSQKMICSVGHAHLHVLPSPAPSDQVLDAYSWSEIPGGIEAISEGAGQFEYLLYVEPDGRTWLRVHDSFESQALRRVFANAHGRPNEWNWRDYPQSKVVLETIQLFERIRPYL